MDSVAEKVHKSFTVKLKQKKDRKSLYLKLYEAIRDNILSAEIPQESELPPTRKLASSLKISRSTVLKAYELLNLEGYVSSLVGSGYKVKPLNNAGADVRPKIPPHISYPELSLSAKSFLQNVALLNSTDDKSIAFRPGLPPLDIFPVTQWKNLSNSYWRYIKSSALSYSPSSGNEQLKKSIASYLNLSRGVKCKSSQVIIVSGSLQSLYLLGNVIMNPNDTILVENPTFPNVKSIFRSLRTKIIGIDVDREGIRTEDMMGDNHKVAKVVHTTPSNHYPYGIQMSMRRRKELVDWAHFNNAFIIENDYEHEINNFSNSLPSLFSIDKNQRTIFLGTFNRLLHPSIRIGYMVLPPYLIEAVEALMKHSHRFVTPSIQVVLNQFIEKKHIYSHVKNVVDVAKKRKAIFKDTFEDLLGDKMSLRTTSVNSLHLIAALTPEAKDQKLCNQLAKKHILAHSLSKCFVDEPKDAGLIFGYSSVRPPVIKRKIHQMTEII